MSHFWIISDKATYPIKSFSQYISFLYPFYYRLAIGVIGAVFIIMLCEIASNKFNGTRMLDFVSHIGKDTLAIYLIQSIVIETILWRFFRFDNVSVPLFQFVISPIFAVASLVICWLIAKFIRRNSISARLMIGDK